MRARECLGIVGESGSGKTQVFMAAMGLLAQNARMRAAACASKAGRSSVSRREALNRVRGSKLTMIFQDPMTSLTPHLKIGVQLAEVLVSHRGYVLGRCEARRTAHAGARAGAGAAAPAAAISA